MTFSLICLTTGWSEKFAPPESQSGPARHLVRSEKTVAFPIPIGLPSRMNVLMLFQDFQQVPAWKPEAKVIPK